MTMFRSAQCAFSRRRRGVMVVEFALSAPLLLLILAGVLDYGLALAQAKAVANAARVGAQYGSSSPSETTDTAGIKAAALNTAPGFSGLTVTSAQTCKCANGSSVSCTGSCTSGKMLIYVQITVSATSSAVFPYPGLPYTGNLVAQTSMRAQ
jgi:Flp pilus assembly protein TadG